MYMFKYNSMNLARQKIGTQQAQTYAHTQHTDMSSLYEKGREVIARKTLSLLREVRPELSMKLGDYDVFTENPTRMCRVMRICREGYGHLLPIYSYIDFDEELDKAERKAGIVRQKTKLVRQNACGGNSEEELVIKFAILLLLRQHCVDQNS